MIRRFVRSAIHNATVTHSESAWPSSLRLDPVVMTAAVLLPREEVEIVVLSTGARFATWVEPGTAGEVRVHSGSEHHVRAGDAISIVSWGLLHDGQTLTHSAKLVTLDSGNVVVAIEEAPSVPG